MSDRERLYEEVQRAAHTFVHQLSLGQCQELWYVLTMTAHRKAPALFAAPPSVERLLNEVGDFLTDAAFGDQEDE